MITSYSSLWLLAGVGYMYHRMGEALTVNKTTKNAGRDDSELYCKYRVNVWQLSSLTCYPDILAYEKTPS